MSKQSLSARNKRMKIKELREKGIGELEKLTVVDKTKIGLFLDWGLERDLFLPFSETIGAVEKGKDYLVGMYIDKSDRLCATMKVKDMLRTDSELKENDMTFGTIYSVHRDFGAFVAVENKYDGLIPKKELLGVHEVGETLDVRINRVLEDGKLDLSLRDRSHLQMDKDAEVVLERLEAEGGRLMLNDNSSPELIREELHMSKSGYKRAIGMLLRQGKIKFIKDGIELK